MDTQWQRYEVFKQERADMPHRNAGSVHAPDGEMALENARDVFARRPNCLSLWVLPERAVYARTVEELMHESERVVEDSPDAARETFAVFQKQGQTARETYVIHVGEVEGSSPAGAMANALEVFPSLDVFVWWVVPERAIIRSQLDDIPTMFDPAQSKSYRSHLAYPVEPIMRKLKSAQGIFDEE